MNILSSNNLDQIDNHSSNLGLDSAQIDFETLKDKIVDLKNQTYTIVNWTKKNIIQNLNQEELKINFDIEINKESEQDLIQKLKTFIQQIIQNKNTKFKKAPKEFIPIIVLSTHVKLDIIRDQKQLFVLAALLLDHDQQIRYQASVCLHKFTDQQLILDILKDTSLTSFDRLNKRSFSSLLYSFNLNFKHQSQLIPKDTLIFLKHQFEQAIDYFKNQKSIFKLLQNLNQITLQRLNFNVSQKYMLKFGLAVDKCNLHVFQILDCYADSLNVNDGINEGYRKWFVEKFNQAVDVKYQDLACNIVKFYNVSNLLFLKYVLCNNHLIYNYELTVEILYNALIQRLHNGRLDATSQISLVDFLTRSQQKFKDNDENLVLIRYIIRIIFTLQDDSVQNVGVDPGLVQILFNLSSSHYAEVRSMICSYFEANHYNYMSAIAKQYITKSKESAQALDSVILWVQDKFYLIPHKFDEYVSQYRHQVVQGTRINMFKQEIKLLRNFKELIKSDPFYDQFTVKGNKENVQFLRKTKQIRNQVITTLLRELENESMIVKIKFMSISNILKNDQQDALEVMLLLFAICQHVLCEKDNEFDVEFTPQLSLMKFKKLKLEENIDQESTNKDEDADDTEDQNWIQPEMIQYG